MMKSSRRVPDSRETAQEKNPTISRRTFLKGAGIAAAGAALGSLAGACSSGSSGSSETYDVMIRNGTIYDGTGRDPYVADIAVKDDRIVAIGFLGGMAQKVIDARGCIVTPGFIDVHDHSDMSFLWAGEERVQAYDIPEWSGNYALLYQGITTVVSGNCGYGFADMDEYFGFLDDLKLGTNTAYLTPHGYLRLALFGEDQPARLDAGQMDAFKRKVAQEMEKGAIGLSTGLGYAPGYLADLEELTAVAQVVKGYGGLYASHIRYEPEAIFGNGNADILEGVKEAIEVGRRTGIPVQVSHIKGYAPCTAGEVDRLLQTVEDARREGIDVTLDQYPYTGASTVISVLVPPEYRTSTGIKDEYKTPEGRLKIKEAIERTFLKLPPTQVVVLGETYTGLTLAEIGEREGRSPADVFVEVACLDEPPGGIFFMIDEGAMEAIMPHDYVFTGCDGGAAPKVDGPGHPRGYGTSPCKIKTYALEKRLMSLHDAIRSMTSLAAAKFGLQGRGSIAEGNFADIAVIDLNTFRDRATYMSAGEYAEGVVHLLVNGALAIENRVATGQRNGRTLRGSSWNPLPKLLKKTKPPELIVGGEEIARWGNPKT